MNANKPLPGRRDSTTGSFIWTVSLVALLMIALVLPAVLIVGLSLPVVTAVQHAIAVTGVGYGAWLLALFQ